MNNDAALDAATVPLPRTAGTAISVVRVDTSRPSLSHGGGAGPRTRFELGSLTKTFTVLLLCEMAVRGDVRLDDPVNRYLPPAAGLRGPAGAQVTLRHLATHTSGLPRAPIGLYLRALPRLFTNPYAGYTGEHLLRAAGRQRLRRRPGTRTRYSTFAMGLLGHALAHAAGDSYDNLVTELICTPLRMTDTGCGPLPELDATGHDRRGRPVPPLRMPGLAAAGALRSTAADLGCYLTAWIAPEATPLAAAIRVAAASPDPALGPAVGPPLGPALGPALGWQGHEVPGCDQALSVHTGGTFGFTAFAGFSPRTGTGLAVLTNVTPTGKDTIIPACYAAIRQQTIAALSESSS